MSGVRPILVTMDKSEITGAIADGDYSSVVSLDIPGMQNGSTRDYCVKQIAIVSDDAPTTWSVIFYNESGGEDSADLDGDLFAAVEVVTSNSAATGTLTNTYYSNSDLEIYIQATATGTQDSSAHANNTQPMQMHFMIAPTGAAKTVAAAGEITIKFWLLPIMGVMP